MAEADFFREEAKESTGRAVRGVEERTSAEVVVAVRRSSGDYRMTSYHFGFGVAALTVLGLWFSPEIFSLEAMALDAVLTFVLGVILVRNVRPLLRRLIRDAVLEKCTQEAARVAFFDLGVSRTRGRTGILVYVSTFEARAVVLTDTGIDEAELGAGFRERCAEMTSAVKRRDLGGFERALIELGPILSPALPRSADDLNELPDLVR